MLLKLRKLQHHIVNQAGLRESCIPNSDSLVQVVCGVGAMVTLASLVEVAVITVRVQL